MSQNKHQTPKKILARPCDIVRPCGEEFIHYQILLYDTITHEIFTDDEGMQHIASRHSILTAAAIAYVAVCIPLRGGSVPEALESVPYIVTKLQILLAVGAK